eukprot:1160009-Pelagomonas_calceolata.AAC.5
MPAQEPSKLWLSHSFCYIGYPIFKAWGAMSEPQWPGVNRSVISPNHRACPLRQCPSGIASE